MMDRKLNLFKQGSTQSQKIAAKQTNENREEHFVDLCTTVSFKSALGKNTIYTKDQSEITKNHKSKSVIA